MTKGSQASPSVQSNLAFGIFSNQWAWRVEWVDAKGSHQTKDFKQRDLRPGEAKEMATAFRETLLGQLAA